MAVSGRNRNPSIDLIRIVAMVLVVFVHLGPGVTGDHFGLKAAIGMLGRLGVPLFVMMTGYLLLDRDYDTTRTDHFVRGNLLRLVVAFEVWNVVWWALGKVEFLRPGGNGIPVPTSQMLKAALFMGDTGTALWYLHMTIALYLGIPLVSWGLQHVKGAYQKTLAGALVFFAVVVPSIHGLSIQMGHDVSIHSVIGMNVFSATVWGDSVWVLYLLVGYASKKGCFDRVPRLVLVLVLVTALLLQTALCFRSYALGLPLCNDYSFVLIVVSSITLFVLLQQTDLGGLTSGAKHKLEWVASRSFGVYVTHMWVLGATYSCLRAVGVGPDAIGSLPQMMTLVGFVGCLAIVVGVSLAVVQTLSLCTPIRRWCLLMR